MTVGELKVKLDGTSPAGIPGSGYGYLFWVSGDGRYRMSGMLGQFGVIFPQHDAVVAITGCTLEEGRLSEIFDKYFPLAFETDAEKGSLESLNNFLEERNRVDIPKSARNPLEKDIDGKTYKMNKFAKGFTGLVNAPYSIMPLAINVSFAQRPHESMDDLCFHSRRTPASSHGRKEKAESRSEAAWMGNLISRILKDVATLTSCGVIVTGRITN